MRERLRHLDDGSNKWSFVDHVLVECPRCAACAHIRADRSDGDRGVPASCAKLTCGACGYVGRGESTGWQRTEGTDWYFNLPLWLRAPCKGRLLWAYNAEHLNLIESYVSAELRERRRHVDAGWCNSSLVSRLPRWMVLAKNRDTVLKGVAAVREKLAHGSARENT
jgi:hypothetical protein